MNCPCCEKRITVKMLNTPIYVGEQQIHGVYQCGHCQALLGQCSRGMSYLLVKPSWAPAGASLEDAVYFDLQVLGTDGIKRRHGWFDPETRCIVQVG